LSCSSSNPTGGESPGTDDDEDDDEHEKRGARRPPQLEAIWYVGHGICWRGLAVSKRKMRMDPTML
jgi:hypothetical protein